MSARRLKNAYRRAFRTFARDTVELQENAAILGARLLRERWRTRMPERLQETEFKVFSQFGDDGIIDYLVSRGGGWPGSFVEFGVENYLESNTRFLLCARNWSGLVIDGDPSNVAFVRGDRISQRHALTALCAFVDAGNIDRLITDAGFGGDIGLLSIDIDGNDYWVWEAIRSISPRLVVCEYNALFGAEACVSVPYDPSFVRTAAHHSNLYYGASLGALAHLAERKGYRLVGTNSAGNNAYFLRADMLADLPALTPQQAYTRAQFRESRDGRGRLTFLTPERQRTLIADLPLVDVRSGARLAVRDLP